LNGRATGSYCYPAAGIAGQENRWTDTLETE
jgi:hypothetical protein